MDDETLLLIGLGAAAFIYFTSTPLGGLLKPSQKPSQEAYAASQVGVDTQYLAINALSKYGGFAPINSFFKQVTGWF